MKENIISQELDKLKVYDNELYKEYLKFYRNLNNHTYSYDNLKLLEKFYSQIKVTITMTLLKHFSDNICPKQRFLLIHLFYLISNDFSTDGEKFKKFIKNFKKNNFSIFDFIKVLQNEKYKNVVINSGKNYFKSYIKPLRFHNNLKLDKKHKMFYPVISNENGFKSSNDITFFNLTGSFYNDLQKHCQKSDKISAFNKLNNFYNENKDVLLYSRFQQLKFANYLKPFKISDSYFSFSLNEANKYNSMNIQLFTLYSSKTTKKELYFQYNDEHTSKFTKAKTFRDVYYSIKTFKYDTFFSYYNIISSLPKNELTKNVEKVVLFSPKLVDTISISEVSKDELNSLYISLGKEIPLTYIISLNVSSTFLPILLETETKNALIFNNYNIDVVNAINNKISSTNQYFDFVLDKTFKKYCDIFK